MDKKTGRGPRKALAFLTLSTCLLAGLAAAQAPRLFEMVDETERLSGSGFQVEGQVVGSSPAPRGVWPATFVFQTGQSNCTATAVGRRVVLTAAHCVGNRQDARIKVRSAAVGLTCHHHPDYPNEIGADFALCLLDAPLPNTGSGFERINTRTDLIHKDDKLLLLGYGCITNLGQRDFGNLYQGFSTVAEPTLSPLYIRAVGGAALCYGDSGGGAYWIASANEIAGRRILVGINSRGDISSNSWLSNTASVAFSDWARKWATDFGVAICGIQGAEDNCRSL